MKSRFAPRPLAEPLRHQSARVRRLHEQDLREGCGQVYPPYALGRKRPTAAAEWAWRIHTHALNKGGRGVRSPLEK